MDVSFAVGEVIVASRDDKLVATNATTCTHYSIMINITGENIEGIGEHSFEVAPRTEAIVCAFAAKPGLSYKWGYSTTFSTRTVAEHAGDVERIDTADAHRRASKLQALVRGNKVRAHPCGSHAPTASEEAALAAAASVGALNERILAWSIEHIGLTVDRGECWDSVMRAATVSGGQFPWGDHCTVWSDEIVASAYDAQPGDILQMFSQKWKGTWGWCATGPYHSAVVAENLGGGKLRVLQCNWGHDKTVQYGLLHYADATTGRSVFYRPHLKAES